MMKSNQLAQVLLATTLAFSVSSQAAEDAQTYTLKTTQGDFSIKAKDTKGAFQAASETVAAKTKDDTLKIGWKTNNFLWDIGQIQDNKGTKIGECRVIGVELDNWKQSLTSTFTLGLNKKPIQYTAYCWDGTKNADGPKAENKFTYEHK